MESADIPHMEKHRRDRKQETPQDARATMPYFLRHVTRSPGTVVISHIDTDRDIRDDEGEYSSELIRFAVNMENKEDLYRAFSRLIGSGRGNKGRRGTSRVFSKWLRGVEYCYVWEGDYLARRVHGREAIVRTAPKPNQEHP